MSYPAPFVRDATAEHRHTIILLHGRGSSGTELAEELEETLGSGSANLFQRFPGVRWVFPSARPRWSSVFEEEMSEWFDAPSLCDIGYKQHLQVEGLRQSVDFLLRVIEEEIDRVGSASKVVLGGISQGQATALHALVCGRHRLGAFVGASGWLPFADKIEEFLRGELGLEVEDLGDSFTSLLATPVFLGHGTDDNLIELDLGKQARDLLTRMGMSVSWKEYEGADQDGHWIKEPEEVDDIVAFLSDALEDIVKQG
ncbi:hypothetical protein SELMODRAFT_121880 [Selaginella moellendorffii]|uniref:Phospholipase/carboxylesterase/thioesterase domain-containing protein n=1 Tax=Selaginella moellendorffii TaxID=88036 RepID=D8SPK1_SELML|nr:hypothetical protein SELMODRAFT_121880 [Selaginella moellendorffii]